MKKNVFVIALFSINLIFATSCIINVRNTPQTDTQDTTSSTGTEKDKETKNEAELNGVYSNNKQILIINKTSASISPSSNSDSQSVPKTSNYNITVDQENKTITMNLSKIWNANQTAMDYDSAIEYTNNRYTSLENSMMAELDKNTSYKSAIKNFNDFKSGYGTTVDNLVRSKIKSYLASQKSSTLNYLEEKFKATLNFKYEVTDSVLTLNQICPTNLTFADATFESKNLILNDYKNLRPFVVNLGDKQYVGTPTISDGNLEAALYDFTDIEQDDIASTKTNYWVSYISDKVATNQLSSLNQATMEKWIDEILGSTKLVASIVTDSTNSTLNLTLSNDFAPQNTSSKINSGETFTLSYSPEFSKQWIRQ